MRAVAQADAHGDGADVEVLHLHHADGLEDLVRRELHGERPLNAMDVFEDVLVLRIDAQPHLLTPGLQASLDLIERQRRLLEVDHHDHGEELAQRGLGDVDDVRAPSASTVETAAMMPTLS